MDLLKTRCRSVPSLGNARLDAFVVHRAAYFLGVIATFLMAHGCAGETQERPRDARHTARLGAIQPNAAPLPSTAFEGPSASSSSSASTSSTLEDRFVRRSIGESSDGTAPRFHGAPVDLDLKEASLQDAFRLLADVGKVNIVVAGEVTGTITMRLKHVPWDQAMDVIARSRGLVYESDGNVILVRAGK